MTLIRVILGKIILLVNNLTTPQSMTRTPEAQAAVDSKTKSLVIYQLVACPFCVKVRRQVKRLGLNIQYKNVEDESNQRELMAGGKLDQVPCLKITHTDGSVKWMYESGDINDYLASQFST